MLYPTVADVLEIYRRVMEQTGGLVGVRDVGSLESAVAQPRMTFNDAELYPSIAEKASALGFSLIMNHPFADGNKRTGHAVMEAFLVANGYEISASVDEQAEIILEVAAGSISREQFSKWVGDRIIERA